MKKKQGAALIWVLMVFTVLIITGTAVMVLITNATQITGNSNVQTNLRIETYTGINLGEYYLVNEENYKKLTKINEKIILNQKEIVNIADNLQADMLIEGIEKYNLNIECEKISEDKYEIVSTANLNGQSYKQTKEITIKESESDYINKEIDNFFNNIAGISILGKNTNLKNFTFDNFLNYYNYTISPSILTTIKVRINGAKNINNFENNVGTNSRQTILCNNCKIVKPIIDNKESDGLNLKLKQGNIITTVNDIFYNEYYLNINNAYLIKGNQFMKQQPIRSITEKEIESSNGILARIGEYQYVFINNGNIVFNGNGSGTQYISNTLVYSTKVLRFDGLFGQVQWYGWGESQWLGENIRNMFANIKQSFNETGQYNQYRNELKEYMGEFNEDNYQIEMTMNATPFKFNNSYLMSNDGMQFLSAELQLQNNSLEINKGEKENLKNFLSLIVNK